MSDDSGEDFGEWKDVEEDGDIQDQYDGLVESERGLKWDYRDAKWKNPTFMYSPMPRDFSGNVRGSTFQYRTILTFMTFFHLFWIPIVLENIFMEMNQYATIPFDDFGRTHGGMQWEPLTMLGLIAFMALSLHMGLERQSNYKTYWSCNTLFHCPMVSNIFTRQCFMALTRCLHAVFPHIMWRTWV